VCSNSKHFSNYIQISCAVPFSKKINAALGTLGAIVSELSETAPK
jgi:hypothetical protein